MEVLTPPSVGASFKKWGCCGPTPPPPPIILGPCYMKKLKKKKQVGRHGRTRSTRPCRGKRVNPCCKLQPTASSLLMQTSCAVRLAGNCWLSAGCGGGRCMSEPPDRLPTVGRPTSDNC
jgi:hypothetical protein